MASAGIGLAGRAGGLLKALLLALAVGGIAAGAWWRPATFLKRQDSCCSLAPVSFR